MVKFGDHLAANVVPAWSQHYIQYNQLKRLADGKETPSRISASTASPLARLRRASNSPMQGSPASVGARSSSQVMGAFPLLSQHDLFESALLANMETASRFFMDDLRILQEKYELLRQQASGFVHDSNSPAAERAEASMKHGFVDLYRHARMLENFRMLNYTAVLKLVKRFDKNHPSETCGAAITQQVASFEMSSDQELLSLSTSIERSFANAFCNGNVEMARADLLVKQSMRVNWVDLEMGIRLGMAACLVIWFVWDVLVDTHYAEDENGAANDMAVAVPFYRAIGSLVWLVWMWGLDILVWKRTRINYLFIFDADYRHVRSHREVWREATTATIVYLVNFIIFAKLLRRQAPFYQYIPAGICPILLLVFVVYKLIFPWSHRKGLWYGVLQVILAPVGRCRFRDTFLGDFMTSLIQVFADLAYSSCFFGTGQVFQMGLFTADPNLCVNMPAFRWGVYPVVRAITLWFRFLQNIRRYRDTHQRFPWLANAFKYAFAQTCGLFGVFHPAYSNTEHVTAYQATWIVIYITSTLYTYSWDVSMDWSLMRPWSKSGPFLRDRLMYSRKWVYYAAIIIDLILRFFWTFSLIPPTTLPLFVQQNFGNVVTPFLAAAEITRRAMWGFFRVENEHLSNTENLSSFEFVPLHFEPPEQKTEEPTMARFRATILEAAGFVVLVAALALLAYFSSRS